MHKRTICRLCSSTELVLAFPMPECRPVDAYHYAATDNFVKHSYPMDLYLCKNCGHAQLLDVVSPDILFGDYIYTSSSSPDLESHFTNYAACLITYLRLNENSFVVDIGSNDGLFLTKFKQTNAQLLGVDPAQRAVAIAESRGIATEVGFLSEKITQFIVEKYGKADLVTANNVFSHNDDLRGFAENVRELLKPEGVFVFEVSYLLSLVKNKVADYIYHEHLAHHSVYPLKRFFQSLGMKLFRVENISTKGGSIRGFASLEKSSHIVDKSVADFIQKENDCELYDLQTYHKLRAFYDDLCAKINTYLRELHASGKLIASYGASATSTVLNRMCDIDPYISFIVDDNQARQGLLSPSKNIPVVGKDLLSIHKPEVVFISSWRFADMIIKSNRQYLEQGGKFLVPLPDLCEVNLDSNSYL